MTYLLDPERGVRTETCPTCDVPYECVTGFVYADGAALGVYYGALHGHDDPTETWLDVTFSEITPDGEPDTRTTFACLLSIGLGIDGGIGAALVDSALEHERPEAFGRRLTREEALHHRRLEDFWAVADFLLEADPDIHAHTHREP